MILSSNQNLGEFDKIHGEGHISVVWSAIEEALQDHWDRFLEREKAKTPSQKLAPHFRVIADQSSPGLAAVMSSFATAVEKYEKSAEKYRSVFDPEAMDEYRDDPNSFKQSLAKEIPVIAGTLNQRRPELQDWQRHFRSAKGKDLLGVFSNLMDFRDEWLDKHPEEQYRDYDRVEEFGLESFENDEFTLANVIGGGIKSIVLFNLGADRLPQRGRMDLYGLYFLSGMKSFGLASDSSEFLMINDHEAASNGSFIMEHNFWYPYNLYSLYVLKIYRWLEKTVGDLGGKLDPHVRYVYVTHFLNEVCSDYSEHMKVMRAHDRFEIPA